MAIVGSASRASRGSTMSGSSTDDNPPARPRQRRTSRGGGGGGGGESEGSEDETTERGSEVCQIGEDMCTVPSQLFDLPSLKGVLSLNTWNYCLTGLCIGIRMPGPFPFIFECVIDCLAFGLAFCHYSAFCCDVFFDIFFHDLVGEFWWKCKAYLLNTCNY